MFSIHVILAFKATSTPPRYKCCSKPSPLPPTHPAYPVPSLLLSSSSVYPKMADAYEHDDEPAPAPKSGGKRKEREAKVEAPGADGADEEEEQPKAKKAAGVEAAEGDEEISCKDCSATFLHTVSDQEFFTSKGWENKPIRCKDCRNAKKAQVNGASGGAGGGGGDRACCEFQIERSLSLTMLCCCDTGES